MVLEPTDEQRVRDIIRSEIQPPQRAYVVYVYEHAESDDEWNHEADVRLVNSGDRLFEVPIATGAAGDVSLPNDVGRNYSLTERKGSDTPEKKPTEKGPKENPNGAGKQDVDDRPECLVEWTDAGEPIITGWLYTDENRSPIGRVNDRRLTVGDATIAIREDENDEQYIQAGFQDDDGSAVQPGIIIRPDEAPQILGQGGTDLLAAAQNPTGGTTPGGAAGGYPSIPTGGAGGDGTGVGDPGFTPSNEITISAGGGPINGQLSSVGGNTLVKLEPGTHKLNPSGSGAVVSSNKVWIQGQGDKREDTKIVAPAGKAGRVLNLNGQVALSNVTFDQSNHPATALGIALTGTGDNYLYNVRHRGKSPNEQNIGGPFTASGSSGSGDFISITVEKPSGSVAHIENYLYKEPEQGIISYDGKNNTTGIGAYRDHAGLLEIVSPHIAWRGEHNIYASRCKGNVHIEGGYLHNSINTNARIAGSGSYIKGTTIHLDMDPSRQVEQDTGNRKAARGLRVESGDYNLSGGFAENCEFVVESNLTGAPLIELHNSASNFEVRNCRLWSGNNKSDMVDVGMSGAVLTGCSFVGPSSKAAVNGNGGTTVKDSCLSMPNSPGFTGCNTSGISSSGCEVPEKAK